MAGASLVDHGGTEIETEATGRFEGGEKIAGTAPQFEHTAPRGNVVAEVSKQLGMKAALSPARTRVVGRDPIEVVGQ